MYTSLKTVSAITIIIGVINAIAAVLTVMMLAPFEALTFTILVAIGAFMGLTSVVLLVIGIALWNLHGDFEAHIDSNYADYAALKKRVDALENK